MILCDNSSLLLIEFVCASMQKISNCSKMRFQIPTERIHFLKFILEGYDGLAVLTTIDQTAGIVELYFPLEVQEELNLLLTHLDLAMTQTLP